MHQGSLLLPLLLLLPSEEEQRSFQSCAREDETAEKINNLKSQIEDVLLYFYEYFVNFCPKTLDNQKRKIVYQI